MTVDDTLWVEKYRPDTLDDVIGHEGLVEDLQGWIDDPTMPHLLLAGRQGIGKTASIKAFAKDKYGENWRGNYIELNASDERGIDKVRDKVKGFARKGTVGDVDFKIIFLDEADNMTRDAQPALRRIIEDYSDTTRFVLSCNYLNQIIDPIQSRCTSYALPKLEDQDLVEIMERVVEGEDLEVDDEDLEVLADHADGDARVAINTLQRSAKDGEVDIDGILSIVETSEVEALFETTIQGNLDDAMRTLDEDFLSQGIGPQTMTDEFLKVIKHNDDIPADARVKMIDKLAEADWRLLNGANPELQLHSFLANLHVARHLSLPQYQEDDD